MYIYKCVEVNNKLIKLIKSMLLFLWMCLCCCNFKNGRFGRFGWFKVVAITIPCMVTVWNVPQPVESSYLNYFIRLSPGYSRQVRKKSQQSSAYITQIHIFQILKANSHSSKIETNLAGSLAQW